MDDHPTDDDRDQDEPRRAGAPRPTNEGVRIIGAEEAAAALEAGQASGRQPDDAPRYGDVPPQPRGPRPSLSFPLPHEGDPAEVAPRQPLSGSTRPRTPEARRLFQPPPARDRAANSPPPAGAAPETLPPPPPAPAAEPERPERVARPERSERPTRSRAAAPPERSAPVVAPNSGPATGPTVLPHWTEPPTGEVPRILPGEDEPDDELGAWSSFSSGPRYRDQQTDWDSPDFEDEPLMMADAETRVGAMAESDEPPDAIFLGEPVEVEAEPADVPITIGVSADRPPPLYDEPGGLREGPGRDVGVAVLTGVSVGLVVLVAAAVGPKAVLLVVGVCLVVAAAELFGTLRQRGHHPATLLGLAGTVGLLVSAYWKGEAALPLVVVLVVVFSLLWYLVGVDQARPAVNVAVTLMVFMYVGFLGSFSALLLAYPGVTKHEGVAFFIGAVIVTVAYDVGAFVVGSRLGRTPLAPSISPNKTWEGLLGAMGAAILASLLIVRAIHPWTLSRAFALALVVSVVAPIGDLCESMLKRDLGVKDVGSVLPGHGGVLDRIDALLFVVPATYYLVRLLKIA